MTPNLQSERLLLRPISVADASAMLAWRGDPEAMRYWDWPPQSNESEIEQIVHAHQPEIESGTVQWWSVILPEGPLIGECDLSEIDHHHKRAEVGFLFGRAHWGEGYAHEAMEAVMAHAFGPLGLTRLWARSHAGNDRSQRLLERLGFSYEGTLRGHIVRDGDRRDCLIHGIVR